jgi:DNA-binding MarR family transcriptional regulator
MQDDELGAALRGFLPRHRVLDMDPVQVHMSRMAIPIGREIREACIAQSLRRAARAATRDYDEALAPLGITIGQLSMLAALDRPEPIPLGQLAEGLGMDRTTLNRNLVPLERRRLVASGALSDDARVRTLSLTRAGRELLLASAPAWRKAQQAMSRRIPGWPLIATALDALG